MDSVFVVYFSLLPSDLRSLGGMINKRMDSSLIVPKTGLMIRLSKEGVHHDCPCVGVTAE